MEIRKRPVESVLRWASGAVGAGSRVVAASGLHGGAGRTGPWRLRIDRGGETIEVVLRVVVPGWIGEDMIATGAAALQFAEQHGLAAPRLIASDLDGHKAGTAVTLETILPGSSDLPTRVSAARLREAGAAIARVHAVPLRPRRNLPLRTRPIEVDDHALERRWAALYRASTDGDRSEIVDAFCELTGWHADAAVRAMTGTHSTPLLQLADDRVRGLDIPREDSVFVHGDVWGGNMLWSGDNCLALIDWKTAGAGNPGIDLGGLRMQMALQYGPDAPAQVLDGWQRESRRQAKDVPYWDAVAALNTPAKLDGWPGFDDRGDPLDGPACTGRRDAFLRAALDRLEPA